MTPARPRVSSTAAATVPPRGAAFVGDRNLGSRPGVSIARLCPLRNDVRQAPRRGVETVRARHTTPHSVRKERAVKIVDPYRDTQLRHGALKFVGRYGTPVKGP